MNEKISNFKHNDMDYINARKNEAKDQTFRYRDYLRTLHNIDLFPYNVDGYYQSLKDGTPIPAYTEPKKSSANRQAGITFILRIKSFLFPEAKKELANRKEAAEQIFEEERKVAINRHKDEEKKFYNRQRLQHEKINERKQAFINGDVNEVQEYFKEVLYSDSYSINFWDEFSIYVEDLEYDPDSFTLSLKYKIPTAAEMLLCNRFEYDSEFDKIIPFPLDKKDSEHLREEITQKVLTRVLQILYLSDSKRKLENVKITGFFEYFDDSFGTIRRKDVIKLKMTRRDFEETDFSQVKISSMFASRIKPEKSKGIYSLNVAKVIELKKKI